MRAAGIETLGSEVKALRLPEPRLLAPDEVLIGVRAAGVGNWDEFARRGAWDIGAIPPMALGVEAAGVVIAVGGRVSRWSPGDAVMTHPVPVREQGAWSQKLIAAEDLLAGVPDGVSWEEAAAFPVPALTAAQALAGAVGARVGEPLLVNGAGGVTGGLIAALGGLSGARVIATAGLSNAPGLKRLGVEEVLDYHAADWPHAVRALTDGAGVSAAVNASRGAEVATLSAVADGGGFATITGAPPVPERGVSIADVYVRADGEQLRELADLLAQRKLEVSIGEIYPLARAADALSLVTHGRAGGAVVLRP